LDLPEDDSYSTLGGFIVHASKEIPQKGEQVRIDNFLFEIEAASNNKIDVVKMIISD
jgi:CBS domain containing-hemolysin-like protein